VSEYGLTSHLTQYTSFRDCLSNQNARKHIIIEQ